MLKFNIIFFTVFFAIIPINGEDMDLIETIKAIEHEVVDLTVIWDLKTSLLFLDLESKADELLENTVKILKSQKLTTNQKMIFIYAIQNANFDDYKKTILEVSIEYENDQIEEYLMKRLLVPYDWNHSIRKNYKDGVVILILETCLSQPNISLEFSNLVKSIKSGKSWKLYKKNKKKY